MLKRKTYDELLNRSKAENRKPLVIKGLRQVGKTHIVRKFAKDNYQNVIHIDFRKNKDMRSLFDSSFNVNDLISQITANIPDVYAVPYKTLLIFDEVQDCPNARSSLKYFYEDGRYDVICTGSLATIGEATTPYLSVMKRSSMDFEEFLWANGVNQSVTDDLKSCLDECRQVLPLVHSKMTNLFRKYICVGGMPEVVQAFVETGDEASEKHLGFI